MPSDRYDRFEGDIVNLGEIAEFGGFNKVGEYIARLNRMDPTTSAKGDPMLVAYFEVLEGKYEGEEIRFNFWLGALRDKQTGAIFAPGVSELKAACAAINCPLGDIPFKLEANSAGRVFGAQFINKRVRIKVLPDPDRKDGKGGKIEGKWENGEWKGPTQPKILGLATGMAVPGPSSTSGGPTSGTSGPETASSPLKGIV